jgi:hypothetical protein
MENKFKSEFKETKTKDPEKSKEASINSNHSTTHKNNIISNNPKKLLSMKYPDYNNPTISTNGTGSKIKCYSTNSYKGTVRSYNEDRIKIILNVIKPESRGDHNWPKTSFFAIYDGHGGNKCANFLKENLHHFVYNNSLILFRFSDRNHFLTM